MPPLQIYLLHSRLQQHRILLRQLPQDLPGLLHPADVILVLRPLHPDHGLPGAVRGGGTGVHVPHRGPTAQLLVAHHALGHLGIAPDCGVLGVAAAVATARGELDSLPSQYCGGTVTTGAVCGIGSDTEMTDDIGGGGLDARGDHHRLLGGERGGLGLGGQLWHGRQGALRAAGE